MDISDWREKIDSLEGDILKLINRRAQYALEIGKIKRQQNMDILDKNRETEILNRIMKKNKGPLTDSDVRKIFETLIEKTRNLESQENGNYNG